MSQHLTEAEAISRAIDGDHQAFKWLVQKHQRFVYCLCYRFVSNRADAEDLTQEAFVRLWKHLPKYRTDVKLTTWLYSIATNLCLDHLKSLVQKSLKQSVDAGENMIAPGLADEHLLQNEFAEAVKTFADSLQPLQKAVFILRELEGLAVEEVSQILSMNADSIKSNLYHARVQITKWMREFYRERKKIQP